MAYTPNPVPQDPKLIPSYLSMELPKIATSPGVEGKQGIQGEKGVDGIDGEAYLVIIESTNGTEFRVGQSTNTLLIAHVFKNGVEVTDTFDPSQFRWRRVSIDPPEAPYDDEHWNTLYSTGYKQISVNVDEVESKASFFCDILTTI